MNRFKNSDDFSIPFTYPFLIYGLVGSAILLFLLVRDSDIKILENLNINNKYIIKEFIYLLKISIPFCIQNIHGTFVHFVHVIVIGMICPRLLPLYQVLIQYNLVVLIIILGSIQAFGLDTIQNVQKRALDLFLQKMKRYLTIIFSLMILCSLFFYFKLFFKIKTYNLLISEKNDLLFSFFIAFISHFIFVIRNINIMTLTNLGDPIFPVMLATSLSLAFGLPMSIILAFLIPYSLTAIHLGILMHYVIATIILMVRGYKNWYFTHDST
jgi:Na+-driven multidrug efflux pump